QSEIGAGAGVDVDNVVTTSSRIKSLAVGRPDQTNMGIELPDDLLKGRFALVRSGNVVQKEKLSGGRSVNLSYVLSVSRIWVVQRIHSRSEDRQKLAVRADNRFYCLAGDEARIIGEAGVQVLLHCVG